MGWEEARHQSLDDHISGVVLGRGEFLENDLALHVEIGRSHRRMTHDVDEDTEGLGSRLGGNPNHEDGRLLAREGVEFATQRVDLAIDLTSGSRRSALEGQVLEEVRRPCDAVGLVTGPHADPGRHRRGVGAGHRIGDDPQPRCQGRGGDPGIERGDIGLG